MKYGAIPVNPLERLALLTGMVPIPAVDALYGLVKARSLMAAVRLGLFEALRGGPRSPEAVAGELGLDAECTGLLMRALAYADYLEQEPRGYRLSRISRRSLLAGSPMDMRGFVEWNYHQWQLLDHLEALVETGQGADFHLVMKDPALWAAYQRAMLDIARLQARVVAKKVPVRPGARRLLDLAGSHGLFGAAICRRHPGLTSTVIDLPAAIEPARALAREEKIDDLVEHRAGDLTSADLGGGWDVALLFNILHHFKPQPIQEILARVFSALSPAGTAAIWEIEVPEADSKPTDGDGAALFFRLTSTAACYRAAEYQAWLQDAGFRRVRVVRPLTTPGNVLVIGQKA